MVLALEVLIAAAVLFAVAAFAAGRLEGMAPSPPDSGPKELPAGRITPAELERLRFPLALRGYRMRDVDAVVERVAAELADRDAEIERLRAARLEPSDG